MSASNNCHCKQNCLLMVEVSVVQLMSSKLQWQCIAVLPPTIMMSSSTDDQLRTENLSRCCHHLQRKVRGGASPHLQPAHQLGVVPDEEPGQPPHHHRLPHPLLTFLPGEAVAAEAGGGVRQTLSAVLAATHISPAAELVELLVPAGKHFTRRTVLVNYELYKRSVMLYRR